MKIGVKNIHLLNELIMKKGFTKTALGQAVKLSNPMIVQITKGTRHPSPPAAKRIVDALDTNFDEIFFIEREVKEGSCALDGCRN